MSSVCAVLLNLLNVDMQVLRRGGNLVIKVIQGGTELELRQACRQHFDSVHIVKPKASRSESAEVFLVALGLKAG